MDRQHAINSIQDVRLLLMRFGTYIYTGDPIGDLELMEDECRELFEYKVIEAIEYQRCLLFISQEKRKYETK